MARNPQHPNPAPQPPPKPNPMPGITLPSVPGKPGK